MYIPLNKNGYDSFIDYLKGVSILFVILAHSLPWQNYVLFPFWGAQAVPVFLLIQVFHVFKKGLDEPFKYNFRKIFVRIFKPFLILTFVQVLLMTILYKDDLNSISEEILYSGGIGPGSYYIWIYLQFYIILPLFAFVIKNINEKYVHIFFVFFICSI